MLVLLFRVFEFRVFEFRVFEFGRSAFAILEDFVALNFCSNRQNRAKMLPSPNPRKCVLFVIPLHLRHNNKLNPLTQDTDTKPFNCPISTLAPLKCPETFLSPHNRSQNLQIVRKVLLPFPTFTRWCLIIREPIERYLYVHIIQLRCRSN